MRNLSSPVTTFTYKTFMPSVAIFILTLAGISRGAVVGAVAFALSLGLALALAGPLKTVRLDGAELQISGYFRSIRVPLHRVVSVDSSRLVSPCRIWLDLDELTPFGRQIVFLPIPRWLPSTAAHPLAVELAQLCSQARAEHAASRAA